MPDRGLGIVVAYAKEESGRHCAVRVLRVSLDTFHFQKGKSPFLPLASDRVERMKKFARSHPQKWGGEVGQGLGGRVEEIGSLFHC